MIKSKSEMPGWRGIDLSGPDGNAFVLLGYADRFAKQLGYTHEDRKGLLDNMKSGSYENLIDMFDKEFGHFVTMWR